MLRISFRFGLLLIALATAAGTASAQSGTIGYSWQGATFGNEGSGWPPDTHGSVGINHFVQSVNGGFQMYNKDGSGYSFGANYISNNTFWTSRVGLSPGGAGYTDPRIYFDPLSRRWFAVEITTTATDINNRILVGRSNTSDPTGSWQGVMFNSQSSSFNDFPTLGVDANALYIGTNNFNSSGAPNGRSIISIPLNGASGFLQNPTGAGSVALVTHSLTSSQSGLTPHGVTDTTGGTIGATTGLILGDSPSSSTQLYRTLVNNPGAAGASLTFQDGVNGRVTVDFASTSTSYAQQGGTTSTLDNGDDRLSSAIYRVGNLIYLTRAVNGPDLGRSVARWTILQVDPSTNVVTKVREGTIDLGGTLHAFFPSIAANARGDFVLSFSRSGASEFPSIWSVVGSTSDFSSWLVGAPFLLQAGSTFQNIEGTSSGGNNRWGDYSATTRDPADPGSFWVTNEYMHNVDPLFPPYTVNDNWATRVIEVLPTVAGEVRWKSAAAGSFAFATAANWQSGVAPVSTDHVIFSRWSGNSYTVDMPVATTTTSDRLSVRQTGTGIVTFNIASGATWSLTNASPTSPSLAISEFMGQSNVAITGGGTLQSNYAVIAAEAGGIGNLTITGSGTTWNNANDVFLGGSSVAAGGTGTLTVATGAATNVSGTLKIWNTASGATLNGSGSTLAVAGLTNAAGSTPTITLNSGTLLSVTNGLGTTYSGVITGAGAVAKSGGGAFTLTGNNTYSGTTTVSAGTLFVNGQVGANSGTGTGAVVVNGGAMGGNGRIGGTVTVNSAGSLAPGTSIGTLTVGGNVVFNSGGKFAVEAAASGTSDLLTIQGASTTLDFKTGSVLDLALLGGFTGAASSHTLASMPSGSGNNILIDGTTTANNAVLGTFVQGTGTSGAVVIQPSGFALAAGDQFQLVRSGDNVVLMFTPVPEPATVLALAAAALGAGALVRRARNRRQPALNDCHGLCS